MPMPVPPNVVNREPVRGRLLLFGPDGKELPIVQDEEGRPFPAGEPMAPIEERGDAPRSMVPPPFVNRVIQPRRWPGKQLTAFQQLRSLADFDLVRVAIEDVKGQILGMENEVTVKKEFKDNAEGLQPAVDAVRSWVDMPDPLAGLNFRAWLGKLLDEILITDALALYPRFTVSGDPVGLEQLDGTTIVPLVDDLGRPPLPPHPAYQQVVHGRPETEFILPVPTAEASKEELWYLPKNRRADNPYGRSATENVLMSVNLAIRHYTHDLSYFTSGNLPDALFSVPDTWSDDQIEQFQKSWDDILAGRSDRTSGGVRFVPDGKLHTTKTRDWKYEYLEWLARVISWSFGVSPLPIMKAIGRNPAEELGTAALEKGPRPIADFIAMILNRYIERVLRVPEVEFAWAVDEVEDAAVVTQRNKEYASLGVITLNTIRKEIGEDPYPPELGDEPIMVTPTGPVFLNDLVKARTESEKQEAARIDPSLIQRAFLEVPIMRRDELRGSIGLPPIGGPEGEEFVTIQNISPPAPEPPPQLEPYVASAADDESSAEPEEEPTEKSFPAALADYRRRVAEDLAKRRRKIAKARKAGKPDPEFVSTVLAPWMLAEAFAKGEPAPTKGQAEVEAKLAALLATWLQGQLPAVLEWAVDHLPGDTEKLAKQDLLPLDAKSLYDQLSATLAEGYQAGAADVAGTIGIDFDTASVNALQFAQEHAAELVGMKWVGGQLVPNPNPVYAITETLRADVQSKVSQALTEGWSPQKLQAELRQTFGDWRAQTIARTETGFAYGEGAADVYEASEVEYVEILDGTGCLPDGHQKGAPKASGKVGVIESSNEADGQIWTVAQYRAHKLGHPNCVRAAVPYFPNPGEVN